jgi:hypothetical protein
MAAGNEQTKKCYIKSYPRHGDRANHDVYNTERNVRGHAECITQMVQPKKLLS